jgi:hypothetical protein
MWWYMLQGNAVHRLKFFLPVLVLALGACDDGFGPGFWVARADTLTMYSASRVEYVGFRSALDIVTEPVVVLPIEAPGLTGNWDVALIDDAAGLSLVPASAFEGLTSRARIAVVTGVGFDELTEAPRDTTLYSAEPVRLQQNGVYVIRSRRSSCGLGSGYRYAKLKPVDINVDAGTLRFAIIRNPYCDDRSFVPPAP